MAVKNSFKPLRRRIEFLALALFIITVLLPMPVKSIVKCNRRLMKEFGLRGMDESINDKMHVCGYVIDKCCTVSDEIAVYRMWNDYTKPIVDIRVDETMTYAFGIARMFYKLMALDPQLIVLKFIERKKVPYDHEICFSELMTEDSVAKQEFHHYHDTKAEIMYKPFFYANPLNWKKKFRSRKYTHDILKKRTWMTQLKPHERHHMYKLRKYKYPTFSLPPIDYNKIECRREDNVYYKEFVIVNEKKTKFCLGLYRRFLRLDNRYLIRFLSSIKNMLRQVNYIKSSFYCSLCDAHQQKYFDVEKKAIMVSDNFCRRLLIGKQDFFSFMHIFFIEYMDEFLQYMQCFETDAKVHMFPFRNFLVKYKRRIPLLQACFDQLDKEDWMTKCWFLCSKYKLLGFNAFFDGDIKLIKRVYLTLYSFIHKLKMSDVIHKRKMKLRKKGLLVKGNVNGMLIEPLKEKVNGYTLEPLDASHAMTKKYYLENKLRKKVLGKLDTRIKPKKDKKTERNIDELLRVLGLPKMKDIIRLKKAHKVLKKKHKFLLRKHKFLLRQKSVKLFLKKLKIKKKNNKRLRKGYSKVNGLKDHLFKIKRKFLIHHGYRPQRVLLNNPDVAGEVREALKNFGLDEKEIEHQIEISKERARYLIDIKKDPKEDRKLKEKTKSKEKDPNRFKAKHKVIEPYHEIYLKSKPHFQVAKFDITWTEDGIRPLKHFALINYRFNITTLIARKFKPEDKIANSVITEYMRNRPVTINRFNFDMRTYVKGAGAFNRKYLLHKKVLRYAKKYKRVALAGYTQNSIKNLMKREARAAKRKRMWKLMLKAKKKAKMLRAIAKHHKKVKVNHHITKEHFWSNFFGIAGLFTKIFGT